MESPCEECIVLASCKNKDFISCTIVFDKAVKIDNYKRITSIRTEVLSRSVRALNASHWSINELSNRVLFYNYKHEV